MQLGTKLALCFPALGTGVSLSHKWQWLHLVPRLRALVSSFPAIDNGCTFLIGSLHCVYSDWLNIKIRLLWFCFTTIARKYIYFFFKLTQSISTCQAITFSNPVYESVYRSDASLGSEVFRRSKVDFSNPVYEALLLQNGSRKSGTMFWGSSGSMNGDVSGNQDTEC